MSSEFNKEFTTQLLNYDAFDGIGHVLGPNEHPAEAQLQILENDGDPEIGGEIDLEPGQTDRGGLSKRIDRFFSVTARGSSLSTEVQAGVANFLTMSYILAANPRVLAESHTPMHFAATSTCFSAFLSTLLAGVFANIPIGCAPGIGLSAFFSFGIASKVNAAFATSDGYLTASLITFAAGALLLLLAATNLIRAVTRRIPEFLQIATIVGMALFLSLVGLNLVGLVRADTSDGERLLQFGDFGDVDVWLAILCIVLISVFDANRVKGGFIASIAATAALFYVVHWRAPAAFVAVPRLQSVGAIFAESNLKRMASANLPLSSVAADVACFVLVLVLDVSGVLFAVAALVDADADVGVHAQVVSGMAKRRSFVCVAVGTMAAALFGCSPVIIHMECLSGVMVGGRTGLTALITALLFAAAMPLLPLFAALPAVATIPCTVFIGAKMVPQVARIAWDDAAVALPAFVTIVVIPFTYSISNGIGCGAALFLILKVAHNAKCVLHALKLKIAAIV